MILLVKIKQKAAAAAAATTTTICREMVNRMSMMGAHCHDFMPLPSSQVYLPSFPELVLCMSLPYSQLKVGAEMFHVYLLYRLACIQVCEPTSAGYL